MYLTIKRRVNSFDNYILFFIKNHIQNKYLDKLMPMITNMGNLGVIWIVMAAALILNEPYELIGYMVILTLIISSIVGEGIIKHIVRRARPYNKQTSIKLLIAKPISYSFPSGHTLSSFAVAEVLSMYFVKYKLIFMAIACLIALSRVYLFVHYPTDVIAGIILGVLFSKIIFVVLQDNGYMQRFIALYNNIF
ncbi:MULTISPECIES: phosphatase PAP2 family protein [Clostridium]|uniref:phosphatase PAP2 family protein n=1 Tax=Clostridium TaxID=1485 RepID=UPI00069E0C82|nr:MULTISPECIES: phosphatase PAP2 family protein [Clostridium]KOF57986.1 phosphatase [Clostridium sp. DMHC 10]MCD2345893.1 phosphatase PAP2 family protein [Clostridium guangxiense]